MANISWKRGISGQFSDAQDWSSNSVPTPNDNVAINARGTYTVTVSANETIRSLTTISTATLAITGGHRLTVTNGTTGAGASAGTISIADSGALETGGTFQNTGKINLNSTGHATDFVIASNTLLTGDGVVQLSDNSHNVIEGLPSRFRFPSSLSCSQPRSPMWAIPSKDPARSALILCWITRQRSSVTASMPA